MDVGSSATIRGDEPLCVRNDTERDILSCLTDSEKSACVVRGVEMVSGCSIEA